MPAKRRITIRPTCCSSVSSVDRWRRRSLARRGRAGAGSGLRRLVAARADGQAAEEGERGGRGQRQAPAPDLLPPAPPMRVRTVHPPDHGEVADNSLDGTHRLRGRARSERRCAHDAGMPGLRHRGGQPAPPRLGRLRDRRRGRQRRSARGAPRPDLERLRLGAAPGPALRAPRRLPRQGRRVRLEPGPADDVGAPGLGVGRPGRLEPRGRPVRPAPLGRRRHPRHPVRRRARRRPPARRREARPGRRRRPARGPGARARPGRGRRRAPARLSRPSAAPDRLARRAPHDRRDARRRVPRHPRRARLREGRRGAGGRAEHARAAIHRRHDRRRARPPEPRPARRGGPATRPVARARRRRPARAQRRAGARRSVAPRRLVRPAQRPWRARVGQPRPDRAAARPRGRPGGRGVGRRPA